MKNYVLVLFFVCCILNEVKGQVDEVIQRVQALIDSCEANKIDSLKANQFADNAIIEAQKSESNVSIAEAMCNKAMLLKHYLQYSKAIGYYDKAIEIYQKEGLQSKVAELMRISGRFHYELGDYETAMKRYMKGLTICEELDLDDSTKGWLLRYIGSVFKRQGDHQNAMSYYRKAYKTFAALNDFDGMASSLNNIGNVYGMIDQDSLQLVYFNKALVLAEENDYKWRAAIILDNIGSVYSDQNDYETAMSYYDKSFFYLSNMEDLDYTFLSTNMQNKAELYIRLNELDLALKAIKKAEFYILKTEKKRRLNLADIYKIYSTLYEKKLDYPKAYEYHVMYNDLDHSLQNTSIRLEIARIQFEHDRERDNQRTKAEKELEALKYDNQRSLLFYLVIGSFILIIFSTIIFVQKKSLSRAYLDLTESLEKEKVLGNLKSRFVSIASHQFRTPLTVIKSNMALIGLQQDGIDERVKPNFEKIISRVDYQIESMTALMDQILVLGKINTGNVDPNFESTDVVALCEEICQDVNEIQEDNRKTVPIINGTRDYFILDPKLLKHAFANLLENAFKYSKGRPEPSVVINFLDSIVEIRIKDEGIGIPEGDIDHLFEPFFRATNASNISGTGLGTAVSKDYIELIGGTLTVTSEKSVGSEFIITLTKG